MLERGSFCALKFFVCVLEGNMAHLVQKIIRLDNDFWEVQTTTPSGFSAERVWDCQQYFAVPLLLMPTGRLVTGTDVFWVHFYWQRDKEIWVIGCFMCVCCFFFFSLSEESHSWAQVLPVWHPWWPWWKIARKKASKILLCRNLYLGKFCHVSNPSNLWIQWTVYVIFALD